MVESKFPDTCFQTNWKLFNTEKKVNYFKKFKIDFIKKPEQEDFET